MTTPSYPAPRARAVLPGTALADRFERHEVTAGFVALGTAEADVIRFSGEPDSVEIWVEDNDAVLRFTDRALRESDTVIVRAGTFYEPRIPCSIVRGRNETAGLVANVQIVGKWAKQAHIAGAAPGRPDA